MREDQVRLGAAEAAQVRDHVVPREEEEDKFFFAVGGLLEDQGEDFEVQVLAFEGLYAVEELE